MAEVDLSHWGVNQLFLRGLLAKDRLEMEFATTIAQLTPPLPSRTICKEKLTINSIQ